MNISPNKSIKLVTACLLSTFSVTPTWAADDAKSGVFGNIRMGLITTEDSTGADTGGTAIGGKLGYISPRWNGLSTGATFFTTQDIGDSDECSFFSSTCDSYSIFGEAFVQGNFGETMVKVGRFGIDTPHADTDDIRMVQDNFQGVLLTNNNIPGTTIYATHLTKWSGVDTAKPEEFTDINTDEGVSALGAVYEGIENTTLQGWYYKAKGFATLTYLEAMYENDMFCIGAQYSNQDDDGGGVDGNAVGITAAINVSDFTLSGAYNAVNGTVTNGYGGGPFFTSADDHTIDNGMTDEKALALGVEYGGIENVTLSLFDVDFDKSQDETYFAASWDISDSFGAEFVYSDMHGDGNYGRLMLNYAF